MIVFHLRRIYDVGYDEARSFIVIAESEEAARTMASWSSGDEGAQTWISARETTCTPIAWANAGEAARVVCRDFISA